MREKTRIVPFIVRGHSGRRDVGPVTENIPGIVGMGKAAELAKREMETRKGIIEPLRDKLLNGLMNSVDHIYLNGHPKKDYLTIST